MKLPSPEAYRSAVQHPSVSFAGSEELARTKVATNKFSMPITYSGNFTATFHLIGESREWAVRCYTREISFVSERYKAITGFLESQPDRAFTVARLVPAGINVAGERFDIIQMEWINGRLLSDYVRRLAEEREIAKLKSLADAVLDLGFRLERLGVSHGDIQHGNVIVDSVGELRLVDYDDMFLPELAYLGFPSGIGQENYQHPGRESDSYDEKTDRFAFISIFLTLRALAARPNLWEKYEGGEECLLFRKADFLDPNSSRLFRELDTIEPIKEFVDRFASICANAYRDVPSLAEFVDGRFRYGRFAAGAKTRPIPVKPGYQSPAVSYAPPESSRLLPTLGGVSAFVIIVLTAVGIFGHRASPVAVDAQPSAAAAAPRPERHYATATIAATHRPVVSQTQATIEPTAFRSQPPSPAASTVKAAAQVAATPQVVATPLQNVCAVADAPAHILSLVAPQISEEKRADSAGKTVIVTVNVAVDGSVADASIKDSGGDVALDFAALTAARRSTYAAAEKSCAPIAGSLDVTVTY